MKFAAVALAALLLAASCGKPEPSRADAATRAPAPTTTSTSTTEALTTTSTTLPVPVPPSRRTAPSPPASAAPEGETTLRAETTGPASDCGGYRTLVESVGLPDSFCTVVGCETGGTFDPHATNGDHAGLSQLARRYHEARAARLGFTWDRMFEPGPNLEVAADLWREQGLKPWYPSRRCWA